MKYLLQFAIELGLQNLAYEYLKKQISYDFFIGVSDSGKQAYQRELALDCEIPVVQYLDSQYPNIFLLNNEDNRKYPNAPGTEVRQANKTQLILRIELCIISLSWFSLG